MNMTSIIARAILVTGLSAVVMFAVTHRTTTAQATPRVVTSRVAAVSKPAVVELQTISVRPSAEDMLAAESYDGDNFDAQGMPVAQREVVRSGPNMHALGLDMPYYSFGKALPRMSKK